MSVTIISGKTNKKKCKCIEILRNIILKDKDKEYGV
jgi:hypothetical protein